MVTRCNWGNSNQYENYRKYHDEEWGKLNLDPQYLYEMLVLESFQSGLSWLTILNKRENFRKAFANFDYHKVAKFDNHNIEALMNNAGIIRNRRKIEAAINNAHAIVNLENNGSSLASLLTTYVPELIINHPQKMEDIPAQTDLSVKISKELKKMGFKFVGPVTVYSFLQAVGLVNDHIETCDFKY